MIWGTGTGVFNLNSSSRLTTDSIITSPDKAGGFPSFSDTTIFLASSVPSPSSDKNPRPHLIPLLLLTNFTWNPPLPPLSLTHLPGLNPFLLSLWNLSRSLYQTDCISMRSISLFLPPCSMGSNRHIVVLLFLFLFWWQFFQSRLFGATVFLGREHFLSVYQR